MEQYDLAHMEPLKRYFNNSTPLNSEETAKQVNSSVVSSILNGTSTITHSDAPVLGQRRTREQIDSTESSNNNQFQQNNKRRCGIWDAIRHSMANPKEIAVKPTVPQARMRLNSE